MIILCARLLQHNIVRIGGEADAFADQREENRLYLYIYMCVYTTSKTEMDHRRSGDGGMMIKTRTSPPFERGSVLFSRELFSNPPPSPGL